MDLIAGQRERPAVCGGDPGAQARRLAAVSPGADDGPSRGFGGRHATGSVAVRRGRRGRRMPGNLAARGVAEDQPAHGGVHVHGLAGARDDPGEAVVDAEGWQSSADAEDPGKVVDGESEYM